ncbi:retropepsin-like aspartic protease family protein [Aurantivibrio plasticivorans]
MKKSWLIIFSLLACAVMPVAALDISVQGLYRGGAILIIDGKQRVLKEGKRSPEGVLLVSADANQAVLDIDGTQQTVALSKSISTSFKKAEKSVVRIASGRGGHFFTPGRINGQAVSFLVDTGATSVAMNLNQAKRLGINYRAGRSISVTTANGVAEAKLVMLDSVRIGDVVVNNVEASITYGDFPREILLGNSFLSRVDLRREAGVLILESHL